MHIFIALLACSMAATPFNVGKQTRYIVKTEVGMMDISAKNAEEAETIASGMVDAQKAAKADEEDAEVSKALAVVANADLSKVDKSVLTAVKSKLEADIAKPVVIDVKK